MWRKTVGLFHQSRPSVKALLCRPSLTENNALAVHFTSTAKCMWLAWMEYDDVLLKPWSRPIFSCFCWRLNCDVCRSVFGHHNHSKGIKTRNLKCVTYTKEHLKIIFIIIVLSALQWNTFCVIFHTVSNLPHHGWNSLKCCEQTCFNYEQAQVNLILPSLKYNCIWCHWNLHLKF